MDLKREREKKKKKNENKLRVVMAFEKGSI